jgi:Xaa-Pro aminopeptidase
MVKSEDEIERIRRSVTTNSRAYERALKRFRPGMRESELAAELDYQMRKLGAEKQAFDTIVASGTRSALPHAHPTTDRIGPDQLLLVDMGAMEDGYASDMTRTVHVGRASAKTRALYRAVLEAQLAAIDAVKQGAPASLPDQKARQSLKGRKLDHAFIHSTGHGLGLEIHEAPRIANREKSRLSAGMVITIEPGVYLEDLGGVRIEDTVLVTKTGCEVLTPTSKEFTVL